MRAESQTKLKTLSEKALAMFFDGQITYAWKENRRTTTHNWFFKTLGKLEKRQFRRFNRFQGSPASLKRVLASFA
ncbi:MAG: hypothetical protein M0T73_07160 [Deltaproteobacteria bacterium]|nr:hypothetical protein [Deltaproteobacteria bacterium]